MNAPSPQKKLSAIRKQYRRATAKTGDCTGEPDCKHCVRMLAVNALRMTAVTSMAVLMAIVDDIESATCDCHLSYFPHKKVTGALCSIRKRHWMKGCKYNGS